MESYRQRGELFEKLKTNLIGYVRSCGIEIKQVDEAKLDNSLIVPYLQAHKSYILADNWEQLEDMYATLISEHKDDIAKVDKAKIQRYVKAMAELIS